MAVLHAHFGAWERSRSVFDAFRVRRASRWLVRRVWLRETWAGLLLQSGDAAGARAAYEEAMAQEVPRSPYLEPRSSPWLANRWAVAAALSGDREVALERLDEVLLDNPLPELLVNRGALKALADDLVGAEADLREAIVRSPMLVPAWRNLARVLELRGLREAVQAEENARQLANRAPRGFPYGVGDGFHLNGQRFMLVLEENRLALYRPARACSPDTISITAMCSGLPPPRGTTVSSPFSAAYTFLKHPGISIDENTYVHTSTREMKSGARR
jgi:tetratricopeptide (TPR) repeat protein